MIIEPLMMPAVICCITCFAMGVRYIWVYWKLVGPTAPWAMPRRKTPLTKHGWSPVAPHSAVWPLLNEGANFAGLFQTPLKLPSTTHFITSKTPRSTFLISDVRTKDGGVTEL